MKACQTHQTEAGGGGGGAYKLSPAIRLQTCQRMCRRGQELAAFDAEWDLQLPPPPHTSLWGHTVYLPTVVRPRSVRAADAREAFR